MAVGVVILLVTLMVGGLIFSNVGAQLNATLDKNDTQAMNAFSTITNTGWSSLTLLAVAAIVGAAVVILALVMVLGRGGGGAF